MNLICLSKQSLVHCSVLDAQYNTNIKSRMPHPHYIRTMIILSPPSVISPRDQHGVCPTEEDSVWGIQWLAILPDATQSARCPGEGNATTFGLAYRRCRIGTNDQSQGVWDAVDASECESAASRAARMKVEHIYVLFRQTNA